MALQLPNGSYTVPGPPPRMPRPGDAQPKLPPMGRMDPDDAEAIRNAQSIEDLLAYIEGKEAAAKAAKDAERTNRRADMDKQMAQMSEDYAYKTSPEGKKERAQIQAKKEQEKQVRQIKKGGGKQRPNPNYQPYQRAGNASPQPAAPGFRDVRGLLQNADVTPELLMNPNELYRHYLSLGYDFETAGEAALQHSRAYKANLPNRLR